MRSGKSGTVLLACLAGLAFVALPAAARQQENGTPEGKPVTAEHLHQQAMALAETPSQWRAAARLLADAAALRVRADSQRVHELYLAGALFYATRDRTRAQESFEAAAVAALEFGQIARAASSYLNAAIVAKERGRGQQASALGQRAERLAHSPHLKQEECDCILNRIVWVKGQTKYANH